jgi:hypothetical protein
MPPKSPTPSERLRHCREQWEKTLEEQEQAQRVQTPLYHYTDAAGLLGIIANQEIWFSSMFHLNDPAELKYGWDIALGLLERHAGRGDVCKIVCDRFRQSFPGLTRIYAYFVGSFSRKPDDLGQWQAYGDDGRGVALGLAPHVFHPTPPTDLQKPTDKAWVAEVIYGAEKAEERLSLPICRLMDIVAQTTLKDLAPEDEVSDFFTGCWTELSLPILWYALQIKHEAYEHEKETRLVVQNQRDELQSHIHMRARGAGLVPYIKHPIAVRYPGNISEILIGPTAEERLEEAVKTLLFVHGLDRHVKVRRSSIPYAL